MEFIRLCCLFFIGGVLGWVLELFFRRFVSQHKWVNPGFLTGPLLPLYGFGLIGLYYLSEIPYGWVGPEWAQYVVKILFIGVALTLVELVAGLIFIKGMKVKLWDYSTRWGNFEGIVCPLFSAIWTAAGAAYVFLLHPTIVKVTNFLIGESAFPYVLFCLGFAIALLCVDLVHSFQLVTKIRKAVANSKLVVDWDKIKVSFAEQRRKLQQKVPFSWAFPFAEKGKFDFSSGIGEYKKQLAFESKQLEMKLAESKAARKNKKLQREEERRNKK